MGFAVAEARTFQVRANQDAAAEVAALEHCVMEIRVVEKAGAEVAVREGPCRGTKVGQERIRDIEIPEVILLQQMRHQLLVVREQLEVGPEISRRFQSAVMAGSGVMAV
jgi:hypothetical protein